MNKRIRVLAEQAGAILEKGYIELSDGQLMLSDNVDLDKSNLDLEKFAELIVRECASLMESEKDYYSKPGSYESREYYERMAAKEDAFDDAAHMIKSHFGVK